MYTHGHALHRWTHMYTGTYMDTHGHTQICKDTLHAWTHMDTCKHIDTHGHTQTQELTSVYMHRYPNAHRNRRGHMLTLAPTRMHSTCLHSCTHTYTTHAPDMHVHTHVCAHTHTPCQLSVAHTSPPHTHWLRVPREHAHAASHTSHTCSLLRAARTRCLHTACTPAR